MNKHQIDQIEKDLFELTHERELLQRNIKNAAGIKRTGSSIGSGGTEDPNDPEVRKRRAAEYALEMTIQMKRADREKKRQELEAEFASVFQEVSGIRLALMGGMGDCCNQRILVLSAGGQEEARAAQIGGEFG